MSVESTVTVLIHKLLWPMAPAVGVALIGLGAMRHDVAELKAGAEGSQAQKEAVIRLETEMSFVRDDISEIKDAVKDIQKEVTR